MVEVRQATYVITIAYCHQTRSKTQTLQSSPLPPHYPRKTFPRWLTQTDTAVPRDLSVLALRGRRVVKGRGRKNAERDTCYIKCPIFYPARREREPEEVRLPCADVGICHLRSYSRLPLAWNIYSVFLKRSIAAANDKCSV